MARRGNTTSSGACNIEPTACGPLARNAHSFVCLLALLLVGFFCPSPAGGASGSARAVGPLTSCSVTAINGSADGPTNSQGAFTFSLVNTNSSQVTLVPSSSCGDTFTGVTPAYRLAALLPPADDPDAGRVASAAVTVGTMAVASWWQMYNSSVIGSYEFINSHLRQLYSSMGVDVGNFSAMTFQAEALLTSDVPLNRAMSLALLAAETQLAGLLTVGGSFVAAAAKPAGGVQAAAAALAAEMMAASLSTASSAANASANGTSSAVPQDLLDGTPTVIKALLTAALTDLGFAIPASFTILDSAVTVISGLCQYIQPYKQAAVASVALRYKTDVNLLDMIIVLSKMAVVQTQAAVATAQLLTMGTGPDPTSTYTYAALDQRMSEAVVPYATILSSLGMLPIDPPLDSYGFASVTGPLTGCLVNSIGLITGTPIDGGATASGRFFTPQRSISWVSVYPVAGGTSQQCADALTGLPVGNVMRNLAVPLSNVTVAPMTLLSSGLYNVSANQSILVPTAALQQQCYAALGIDYDKYMAAWASSNPWSANSSTPVTFNNPWLIAGAAANTQVVGLLFMARALFARSASVMYNLAYGPAGAAADELVIKLAVRGMAAEALKQPSGAVVDLTDKVTVNRIFSYIHANVNLTTPADATARRRLLADEDAWQGGAVHVPDLGDAPSGRQRRHDRRIGRTLAVYDSNPSFTSIQTVVTALITNINSMLADHQAQAIAAAAGASNGFSPQVALLNITRLSYISQSSLYTALTGVLNSDVYTGTALSLAMVGVYNSFTDLGLALKMAVAPINAYAVCTMGGGSCAPMLPPPPPPPAAAPSSGGLSTGAIIGIAVAASVGGLLLLGLVAWFVWRNQQKKTADKIAMESYKSQAQLKSFVNPTGSTLAAGSMTLGARRPSMSPPDKGSLILGNAMGGGSAANMNGSVRRDVGYTSAYPLPSLLHGSMAPPPPAYAYAYAGMQPYYPTQQYSQLIPQGSGVPSMTGPAQSERVSGEQVGASGDNNAFWNAAFDATNGSESAAQSSNPYARYSAYVDASGSNTMPLGDGTKVERPSLVYDHYQSSLRAPPQAINMSLRARPEGLNASMRPYAGPRPDGLISSLSASTRPLLAPRLDGSMGGGSGTNHNNASLRTSPFAPNASSASMRPTAPARSDNSHTAMAVTPRLSAVGGRQGSGALSVTPRQASGDFNTSLRGKLYGRAAAGEAAGGDGSRLSPPPVASSKARRGSQAAYGAPPESLNSTLNATALSRASSNAANGGGGGTQRRT